jgi:hypothetical protein
MITALHQFMRLGSRPGNRRLGWETASVGFNLLNNGREYFLILSRPRKITKACFQYV